MRRVLSIKNLNKSFDDKVIFNDFSLEVFEQEFVVIAGKSGCGKTTLLNMIGLLERYEGGEISLFEGNPIEPYSKRAQKLLAEKIGFLFQNYALIDNETVEDNLKIVFSKKDKNMQARIDETLQQLGILSLKKKQVYKCSGGEQQRIAVARLLLKRCELILADEPTGSLDSITKKEVFNLLKMLKDQGKTLIIVSHDEDLMKVADRVIKI